MRKLHYAWTPDITTKPFSEWIVLDETMDEIDYQFAEEDSPELMTAKLRATFRDEAYELLAELENALLALEEDPSDQELVNRIFRSLHTIKGSGGACGFDGISRFAHEVEAVYDLTRNGKLAAIYAPARPPH